MLLLLQTGLAIWLTDRVWGRASRTPAQLAELAASDLSTQLAADPSFVELLEGIFRCRRRRHGFPDRCKLEPHAPGFDAD